MNMTNYYGAFKWFVNESKFSAFAIRLWYVPSFFSAFLFFYFLWI